MNEIKVTLSQNDLQNLIVSLKMTVENPALSWEQKRELMRLGDKLILQSQQEGNPDAKTE